VPVFALPPEHVFPDPELADESGLLAVGGDLNPQRLLLGYSMGIFPWYSEGQPILWHSPDPRFVLFPDELSVPRSLRQTLRKNRFSVTMDTAFREVITQCATVPRSEQFGTWITGAMEEAYCQLHQQGVAHSVEAWDGEQLVGGLYGISLGGMFFGESMFALASDASKVAFVSLVDQLGRWGFDLVDSQVHTDHVARFGGKEIPRSRYLELLNSSLASTTRTGPWAFDGSAAASAPGGGD
jgi:leucyl/phenylalanyl-tRNA--protein transferase